MNHFSNPFKTVSTKEMEIIMMMKMTQTTTVSMGALKVVTTVAMNYLAISVATMLGMNAVTTTVVVSFATMAVRMFDGRLVVAELRTVAVGDV